MSERVLVQPDVEFISYLKYNGGDTLKKCFQCASCSVVCSLSPEHEAFPRKEMISAGWGQKESLISDPDVWLCHGCADCTTHCPRGAKPSETLAAVRSYIIEYFAFPRFMGSALKSPKYLLLLLIVCLFFTGLIFINRYEGRREEFLLKNEIQDKNTLYDKIARLERAVLQQYAYDFSNRDDIVSLLSLPDKNQADKYIRSILPSFDVNAAWIYDHDFNLVYSCNTLDIKEGPELKSNKCYAIIVNCA